MKYSDATLFVVDDDNAVSNALAGAAKLIGVRAEVFGTADEFLAAYDSTRQGCLILDYKLPTLSGLELQRRLNQLGSLLPVIMISGHADVRTAVEAMRNGALNFLEKPFSLEQLCREIEMALALDKQRRAESAEHEKASQLVARLTRKEREVFDLVAEGKTNKEIAKALNLSVRAVEDRRARMMKRLQLDYLSDVITIASRVPKPKSLGRIQNPSSPHR